jgi:hypothetical protein
VSFIKQSGGKVGGNLMNRLAATDRLHCDFGFVLGTVGAALAYGWEPLSEAVPHLRS